MTESTPSPLARLIAQLRAKAERMDAASIEAKRRLRASEFASSAAVELLTTIMEAVCANAADLRRLAADLEAALRDSKSQPLQGWQQTRAQLEKLERFRLVHSRLIEHCEGEWVSWDELDSVLSRIPERDSESAQKRLRELAQTGAAQEHNYHTEGIETLESGGHFGRFDNCPHPDCVLVREPQP